MPAEKEKSKYERFCEKVTLQQLNVVRQTVELIAEPNFENTKNNYFTFDQVKTEYKNNEKRGFTVWHSSKFDIFHLDENSSDTEDETSRNVLFKVFVRFKLQYTCDGKIDDEIFEAFKEKNVVAVCHPYFREIVASSMFRAGLPVITLPLIVE